MDPTIAVLVLLAALLHAGWNALVKVSAEQLVAMALVAGSSGLLSLLALPLLPLPLPASWPYLAASLALHIGYMLFLLQAYRYGDLGHVYPIARGGAPLIAAAGAFLVVGETLDPAALAGILLITAGIAGLALRGGNSGAFEGKPAAFALATALFIAAYTVVDGKGARLAGSAHGYTAWLFALDGIPVSVLAWLTRRRALLHALRFNWRPGLAGGVMSLIAYWLVIWAMTRAPIAPVAALRETSVLFATLIATFMLRERFGAWRMSAAAVVVAGAVLLQI